MEELSNTMAPSAEKIQALRASIAQTIVGQAQATDLLLTTLIAGGHVLIEGVLGVAKTDGAAHGPPGRRDVLAGAVYPRSHAERRLRHHGVQHEDLRL